MKEQLKTTSDSKKNNHKKDGKVEKKMRNSNNVTEYVTRDLEKTESFKIDVAAQSDHYLFLHRHFT